MFNDGLESTFFVQCWKESCSKASYLEVVLREKHEGGLFRPEICITEEALLAKGALFGRAGAL